MKKLSSRTVGIVLAFAMVLFAFVGCTSDGTEQKNTSSPDNTGVADKPNDDSEKTSLTFWCLWDGPDGAIAKEMVEQFSAEKGIDMEFMVFSSSQYYTKLKAAGLADDCPDVAVSHVSGYIPEYKNDGIILPISKVAEELGVEIKFEDYVSDVVDMTNIDGEYYALPIDNIARLIYFNKAMLEGTSVLNADGTLKLEAGLDNFEAMLEAIKNEVPDAIAPMAFNPAAPQFVLNWLAFYSQKADAPPFFDYENGEVSFDETIAAEVLEDYSRIYNTYSPVGLAGNSHLDLFYTGQVPLIVDGTFVMGGCEDALGDDLGIAYYPQWYDKSSVVSGSHSLMLMNKPGRSDEDTKMALEFIKWFGDNDHIWAKSGALPANKNTYDMEEFTSLPGRADLMKATESSLPLPMLPVGMIHQTIEVKESIEKAMLGQMPFDETVATVKDCCQKIFDEYK